MDPLSDIIALLRPSTAVAKPISGRGSWGVRYGAYDAPGFTLILKGAVFLEFERMPPIRMEEGDFLLIPSTPAFALYSEPGAECRDVEPAGAAVRHGEQEGEADFIAMGGTFDIARVNAALLLALLPDYIHIRSTEGRAGRLGQVIDLITDECVSEDPGKDMIVQRLLEILLVESLRWRNLEAGDDAAGLLSAMRDPQLARALLAIHADVRAKWTVSGLASVAGMSRSAFAARFGEILGCGPIEYLSRWRMALAKDALTRGNKTLDRVADEIGYESASAFSTAFRKRLGISPGRFAHVNTDQDRAH